MKQFIFRLKLAYRIVIAKKRFVIITVERDAIVDVLLDDKVNDKKSIVYEYVKMREHHAARIIKEVARRLDDIDIICSKAEFDIEFERS